MYLNGRLAQRVLVALGILAGSLALKAQVPPQSRFQPELISCVLTPAPTPPAPWPVAATDPLVVTGGAPVTFSPATLLVNDSGTTLSVVRVGPTSVAGGTITGSDPLTYTPPAGFAGTDTFTYEISDFFGQTTVGLVKVTATADVVAPTVSITAPLGGTVSGTVTVRASAADNVRVVGVRFFDGTNPIGVEVTIPPYETAWNTTLVLDGPHTLTAVARDAAGHATTSAPVVVNVSNVVVANVIVPNVVGRTRAEAEGLITGAHLIVGAITSENHATIPAGSVIRQNPAADASVAPGSAVALVISLGPATATPPDLVLALGFDEAAGSTALDASGGNRNGVITGAQRVAGKVGGALQFDGFDDVVTVADSNALDLTTGMTVSAWVNPTAFTGWETVALKERGAGDLAYALYAHDGAPLSGGFNAPAGYVKANGVHQAIRGTAPLTLNAWTHLATTYDGATQRLYINGALVASRSQTGLIAVSANPLRVGGNSSFSGEYFQGVIDSVHVYSRALSTAEITTDMNVGQVTPPTPPANSAPVAQSDSLTTTTGSPVTFTAAMLLANDTDADGNPLSVTSVAATTLAGGTVSSAVAGSWTYTPPGSFSGADSFTYTISDGAGGSATGTVNVTVNAPAPPPAGGTGLVAAYSFNEGAGTAVNDLSGNARNGTIRGAVFVAGKSGTALQFDGADDWVTVTDVTGSPLDLTTGMTLEAWVNPWGLSGWETVMLKERGAGLLSYALYAHDGAPLSGGVAAPAGYVRAGGIDQAVRGLSALPLNTWTHIATTYDGVNERIYVNGALVASRPQTGAIAVGNGALRIGGNNSFASEFFMGLIDEVRVYNRALTGAEITTDMSTPLP